MDFSFLGILLPMLFKGLKITLLVASLGILFGFLLGTVAGFGLESKNKILKGLANIYIYG